MPKIRVGNITMNYGQQGSGEPLWEQKSAPGRTTANR